MKHVLKSISLIVLSLILGVTTFASSNLSNDVVATVNDVIITHKDISIVMGCFNSDDNIKRSSPVTDKEALNILIRNEMINQLFEQENITISEQELQAIKTSQDVTYQLIETAIENGTGNEKFYAEEVMKVMNDTAEACGLTLGEYKDLCVEHLAFSQKLSKLADEKFNGDKSAVDQYVAENYDTFNVQINDD